MEQFDVLQQAKILQSAELHSASYFADITGLPVLLYDRRLPAPESKQHEFEYQKILPQRYSEPILKGRVTGAVRLVEMVYRAWGITEDALADLLAYPNARNVKALLAGRLTFSEESDRADRARLIYDIHATLASLFVNSGDEQYWINAPHPLLKLVSPLDYMLRHRIPGMVVVRQLAEQKLANR